MSANAYLLLALGLAVLLLTIAIISLWKHKHSGTGRVQLLGASAVVQTELDPEGDVLIGGELWRARSSDGTRIAAHEQVTVTAVEDHLVIVNR